MSRLKKASGRFTEKAAGDEIIVMTMDSGKFLSLTGTAAAAWSLIDGTRNRDALISALAEAYTVNERHIAADVDQFIEEFKGLGLLADV